jgi:hypothetical protein
MPGYAQPGQQSNAPTTDTFELPEERVEEVSGMDDANLKAIEQHTSAQIQVAAACTEV